MSSPKGRIFIISGQIGSGKSTFLRKQIISLRKSGRQIQGLVTEERNGERWTIDLSTGHAWILAHPNSGQPGISTPRYVFDAEGISHANAVLRRTVGTDVLIIDELGPLELLRQEGWVTALEILDRAEFNEAYIVIRESLINVAQSRWPESEILRPESLTQEG
jgi:nucleoside-triphosphatase THEP1